MSSNVDTTVRACGFTAADPFPMRIMILPAFVPEAVRAPTPAVTNGKVGLWYQRSEKTTPRDRHRPTSHRTLRAHGVGIKRAPPLFSRKRIMFRSLRMIA